MSTLRNLECQLSTSHNETHLRYSVYSIRESLLTTAFFWPLLISFRCMCQRNRSNGYYVEALMHRKDVADVKGLIGRKFNDAEHTQPLLTGMYLSRP